MLGASAPTAHGLQRMPHLDPSRPRPRLRHRAARWAAAIAGAVTIGAWTTGAVSARVLGDQHSPTVVQLADVALAAQDTFTATGTPGDFVTYLGARDATADAVAAEMAIDPA